MTGQELGPHALAVLLLTAAVLVVFMLDRLPIATVCLGLLALLPLGFALWPLQADGVAVDPLRFFAGFGHPALVAICALMVVGQGLVVTGALAPVARRLSTAVARSPRLALLAVLVAAAGASGVVNDTPVVVLFIPLLLAASAQASVPAAGLLMPMNHAVLIGGMATTIGTSTNLIVVAMAAGLGLAPIGMFAFFDLVAMAAVPALLYLWLVAPRWLARVPASTERLSEDLFDAELVLGEHSALVGQQLRAVHAAAQSRVELVGLRRGAVELARLPSLVLRPGDRLQLRATARRLKALERLLDSRLHDLPASDSRPPSAPVALVAQLVVGGGSPLVGRSVRELRVAERFELVVVGLRPRRQVEGWQRQGLADRRLAAGDVLLVQGSEEALALAQREGLGLLLDQRFTPPRHRQAPLALGVMAGVVLAAALQWLPIALAALLGALVLVLTRVLRWPDVTQSLSTKVVLLVAASLALGDALAVTGATAWLGGVMARGLEGLPPAAVAAVLMAGMGLLTNVVSNNAAAAIGTPLAVSLAAALGAPPEPFVLAVLFGCNLCYLTPMGYQTNLLVMNAGGYRFGDFVRVGTPLFVIMWAGLSAGLAWRYFS